MTQFIVGRTKVAINDNSVCKIYENINEKEWKRVLNASLLLEKNGIGPKIISIDGYNPEGEGNIICYQKVTPFDAEDYHIRPRTGGKEMSDEDLIKNISSIIRRLHSLGYAHGDLHLSNIGFIENYLGDKTKFVILDHDTIFKINNPEPWVKRWMEEGFDWEDSYKDFVNHDLDNFMFSWLGNPPEDREQNLREALESEDME